MKWATAMAMSCALEVIPFILLVVRGSENSVSALSKALIWYHIVPLTIVSWIWLMLFGHGAPAVNGWTVMFWDFLFWATVFVGQVILVSPVCMALLKVIRKRTY